MIPLPKRIQTPVNRTRLAKPALINKPTKPPYDRVKQLTKLVGLWPHELQDCTEDGTLHVIALLRKALRGERQRGHAGHWTYDLNRHVALVEALREERARLQILRRLPLSFRRRTTQND
jgi:hypothetical protein